MVIKVLMRQVIVKDEISPWKDKQGIVVCERINGKTSEGVNGRGLAKVRIGNSLTEWISFEKLKVDEPYLK